MIVRAKYVGPFAEVTVPGFENKVCKRGDPVLIRIPDDQEIGACWEVLPDDQPADAADQANDAPEAVAAASKKKGG